jgi:hypothetical protein
MKIKRFQDVPMLTSAGHWECNYRIDELFSKIKKFVEEDGLNLNPDFQRFHVWSEAQQIAYVEFILRGGTTGRIIYLNHPGWMNSFQGDFVLVDGKQRLEALRRFFEGELPVFGSYIHEFTDKPDWLTQGMKININNLKSRREVIKWYIDMNAGGTPHTAEEIEKAQNLLREENGKSARK